MILRKNISLNEEYLKKLEPLMQKHNDNLSAVIREVIDLADAAFQDPDSVKKLISGLKKEENLTSSALIWALKNLAGRLPDEGTVQNIIGSGISSISSLEKRLNELAEEIYWDSSIKISADDDSQPGSATFTITGKNPDMNRFLASVIAVFAAKKYNLGLSSARNTNGIFEMNMKRGENEWAIKSVGENFGYLGNAFSELYRKPDFWNILISLYAKMNYDMATIPRQLLEDTLGGGGPKISASFEKFFGCPINNIPLEDFLKKIKLLYQAMGLIEEIDINKDSLIIHHAFTDLDAVEKLAAMFVELLSLNGQTYSSTYGENLIVLKPMPAVGKILMRMAEGFKLSEPRVNYRSDLLKMLDMLKNVPSNEDFIKSLGYKFGRRLIQNYEEDKKIQRWDASTFVRYVQEIGTILAMESKWTAVSENVIQGKIIACPLVKEDSEPNLTNCTFIKGIFDGLISHAFGERTERVHTLSAGEDFCEIYVAF